MQMWTRMTDAATSVLWNVGTYAWVRGREAALLRAETAWLQGTRSVTTAMLMMATAAALTAWFKTATSAMHWHAGIQSAQRCVETEWWLEVRPVTMQTWTTVTDARGRVVSNADTFAWGQVQGAAQLPAETAWLQGTRSATTATLMPVTDAVRLAQWRRASRVPIKHADRHHQRHHAQRSAGTEL